MNVVFESILLSTTTVRAFPARPNRPTAYVRIKKKIYWENGVSGIYVFVSIFDDRSTRFVRV